MLALNLGFILFIQIICSEIFKKNYKKAWFLTNHYDFNVPDDARKAPQMHAFLNQTFRQINSAWSNFTYHDGNANMNPTERSHS